MRLISLTAVLGLTLAVGCTPAKNTARGTGSILKETVNQVDEATTDPSITFAIKSAMIEDDLVRAREINVDTENGVVTLNGTQPSQAAIDRAEQLAWRADGVTKVVNRLTVKAP